jgi:HD-like signal output (HDOD) protein
VAAVACELGRTVSLSPDEIATLDTAARLRACDPDLFEGPALARLAADALGGCANESLSGPSVFLRSGVADVLRAYHSTCSGSAGRLSELIHVAESLDGCMEWEPYATDSQDTDPMNCLWESPLVSTGLTQLRATTLDDLRRITPELPPFSEAALHALSRLTREDLSAHDLVDIAATDVSFAGRIIAAANSALLSPRVEIRSLLQAVNYIGCAVAKKVLIAAATMQAFAPESMRPLRTHSIECADVAAQIAVSCGRTTASEAFLAGLVHDVGALALALIDAAAIARRDRLVASGCPRTYAEQIVCGFDHAKAGAIVLEHWKFPPDLVRAVEYHHRPEACDSIMAAVLYAAEFWTCSEEDLASAVRLRTSFDRLGITADALQDRNPHPSPLLLSAFVNS